VNARTWSYGWIGACLYGLRVFKFLAFLYRFGFGIWRFETSHRGMNECHTSRKRHKIGPKCRRQCLVKVVLGPGNDQSVLDSRPLKPNNDKHRHVLTLNFEKSRRMLFCCFTCSFDTRGKRKTRPLTYTRHCP
jgi:hypothetical protein